MKSLLSEILGLPLVVLKGFLGRVQVNVPWSSLNRDPVVINLSDLIIICRSECKMDADLVDKIKRNLKMRKVNGILEKIIKKSSHE